MVAFSSHSSRLWMLSFLFLGIVLSVTGWGKHAGATARSEAMNGVVYLPHIGKTPGPPQLGLVPFAVGFDNVTIMDITNAGDERLFVANREGKVWIVYPDGAIEPTPFLDVTNKVEHEGNFEMGFLGLAFHPDFPAVPYFYFTFTTRTHIEVARGEVNPARPNVADPDSIEFFIAIRRPEASGGPSKVHNAGDLAFGPDGYLYIPVGDGGPDPYDPMGVPGDPNNNSQRRDTMLGSILRIDPDPARGRPQDCGKVDLYSIPADNPWLFDEGCDEIWAKGLRNPWRMSIDPLTGDFYIADVGEWQREEVNFYPGGAPGGANFGWHCWEGTVDYTAAHPDLAENCPAETQFTFPVHEYDHSLGECSIIGGKLYRGSLYPALYGRYFFGDWCSGRLWTMARNGNQWKVDPAGQLPVAYSTFGEDVHGELYAGSYANGTLFKVVVLP